MTAPVIDRPQTLETDGGSSRFSWSQYETEFAKPCQVGGQADDDTPQCPNVATWVAGSKHGINHCPSEEMYLCDQHMQEVLSWWQQALKLGVQCERCKVKITGLIKDFLTAIRL